MVTEEKLLERIRKIDVMESDDALDGYSPCAFQVTLLGAERKVNLLVPVYDADPDEIDIYSLVAEYYGTPVWLEHLIDVLYENLPEDERLIWIHDITCNIPINKDFVHAFYGILAYLLELISFKAESKESGSS